MFALSKYKISCSHTTVLVYMTVVFLGVCNHFQTKYQLASCLYFWNPIFLLIKVGKIYLSTNLPWVVHIVVFSSPKFHVHVIRKQNPKSTLKFYSYAQRDFFFFSFSHCKKLTTPPEIKQLIPLLLIPHLKEDKTKRIHVLQKICRNYCSQTKEHQINT